MYINDDLYGSYTLEPVLIDLMNSKAIQRLKGIHQGGASYLVNEKWNQTRYEHSVGVMLLIRKLGGCLEEQIAGLLHDVSHTAFSHVIDFVLKNGGETYHEDIFQKVVLESEIPKILATYEYDVNRFFDDSRWTLLEQPAPDLCADRIDYTLRDMYQYGKITLEEVQKFLQDLVILEGEIYLSEIKTAEWFVETYYKEVIDFFIDPLNVYGYDKLSKLLASALESKVIKLEDFLLDDETLMRKLRVSTIPSIRQALSELHSDVKVIEDKNDYSIHLKSKVRLIDPYVIHRNQCLRSSELSTSIREMNKRAHAKALEGTYVRVVTETLSPPTTNNPV